MPMRLRKVQPCATKKERNESLKLLRQKRRHREQRLIGICESSNREAVVVLPKLSQSDIDRIRLELLPEWKLAKFGKTDDKVMYDSDASGGFDFRSPESPEPGTAAAITDPEMQSDDEESYPLYQKPMPFSLYGDPASPSVQQYALSSDKLNSLRYQYNQMFDDDDDALLLSIPDYSTQAFDVPSTSSSAAGTSWASMAAKQDEKSPEVIVLPSSSDEENDDLWLLENTERAEQQMQLEADEKKHSVNRKAGEMADEILIDLSAEAPKTENLQISQNLLEKLSRRRVIVLNSDSSEDEVEPVLAANSKSSCTAPKPSRLVPTSPCIEQEDVSARELSVSASDFPTAGFTVTALPKLAKQQTSFKTSEPTVRLKPKTAVISSKLDQSPSLSESIQRVKDKNIEPRRAKVINVIDAPNPTTRRNRMRNISEESHDSHDRSERESSDRRKERGSRGRSEKGESRDRGKIFPPLSPGALSKSSDDSSSSDDDEPQAAKRKKVQEGQKVVVRVKGKDGKPKMVRITKAKHEELLLRQRRQEVLAKRIPKLSSRQEFRNDFRSPKKTPAPLKPTAFKGWSNKLKSPSKKISIFSPPKKEKFVSAKSASSSSGPNANSDGGQNAFSLTQILGPEVAPQQGIL